MLERAWTATSSMGKQKKNMIGCQWDSEGEVDAAGREDSEEQPPRGARSLGAGELLKARDYLVKSVENRLRTGIWPG